MRRRIAINGFGRIGRLVFRSIWQRHRDELEIVAVNDPGGAQTDTLLLEFDSTYGRFPARVRSGPGYMNVDGEPIAVLRDREWTALPWADLGVETVLECTGRGTQRQQALKHLSAGARQVIISAPGKDDDITLVMGVNESDYHPGRHRIISNGSCTTNCLGPVALVLKETFGITWGLMTTVHSYTGSQALHDHAGADARESRAATQNIIPTSSGAAETLPKIIPSLGGLFGGMAFRVPTPTVSAVDFVCETRHPATVESVTGAFRAAASGKLAGILDVCDRPLVSSDFRGDDHSAIVDALSTVVLDGRIVKVIAWYDNEWGYACRLGDLAAYVARRDAEAAMPTVRNGNVATRTVSDRRIEEVVRAR
jgi:glyceraldehyde 3-phosphate dehydrogenase